MIVEYPKNLQRSHNKVSLPRSKTKHEKMYNQNVNTYCSTSCCDTFFNKIVVNPKNTDLTITSYLQLLITSLRQRKFETRSSLLQIQLWCGDCFITNFQPMTNWCVEVAMLLPCAISSLEALKLPIIFFYTVLLPLNFGSDSKIW